MPSLTATQYPAGLELLFTFQKWTQPINNYVYMMDRVTQTLLYSKLPAGPLATKFAYW